MKFWLKNSNFGIISHSSFLVSRFYVYLCTRFRASRLQGEMVEWSITAVLKTAVLRGTGGSNPSLSAVNADNQQLAKFTHVNTHTFRGLRAYFFSQYL